MIRCSTGRRSSMRSSAEEVLALCAEVFVEEEVPPRARLVLDDVFGDE